MAETHAPSLRVWVLGARPRTLGAAIAPVLVGTAAGALDASIRWDRAGLAVLVALALQVGVNYANDFADGVRGTDADRVGPTRLTASGLASAPAVRNAAIASFGVAAAVGLALSLMVTPWLLLVGVAAIGAAWTYTGGPRPYGYAGLGELAVLLFFGFAATLGSAFVQSESLPAEAWWGSLVVGLPACAVLLANNIRDIETDRAAGKRTLAVRIGARKARVAYVVLLWSALAAVVPIGILRPPAILALGAAVLAIGPTEDVLRRDDTASLIRALVGTVRYELALAVLLTVGLLWS